MPEGGFSLDVFLKQLGIQLLGVVVCFVWAFGASYLLFTLLKKTVGLRVSPDEERNGITLFPKEKEVEEINEEELNALLDELG